MEKTINSSFNIEINDNSIVIDTVRLYRSGIETLDAIQNDLADHYINTLQHVGDMLLDACESIPVEYDELILTLQALRNLRSDLRTIKWGTDGQEAIPIIEALDRAAAGGDDAFDAPEDPDDSEMDYAGK